MYIYGNSRKTNMDYNSNIADSCEWDFVGRNSELLLLEKNFARHRLFGVFGIRSVGKSRLVQEFLNSRKLHVVNVELKLIDSLSNLYTNICALIGEQPIANAVETTRWVAHLITAFVRISKEGTILVNFDNAEDAIEGQYGDDFLLLINYLVKNCRDVKLFISSTTRVQFSQLSNIFYTLEVLPLPNSDSKALLQIVAPEIDFGEFMDAIVNLSEGLPLVLLMIGSNLKEDDGMITPEEMVELLVKCRLETLSSEFYPQQDRVGDVYRHFVLRLSDEFQTYLTELDYIPGSFNAKEACGLLAVDGSETQALTKHNIILPIRRRHILNYDADKGRFNIQGILREVIKATFAIKNLPELRRKYCEVFTDVMGNISNKMGTSEYAIALSEFAAEQPNLVKLLSDVEYTQQDTYKFFIQIAAEYTQLIERFMPAESEMFYEACLKLSDMYKRTGDKARVHLAVGSMATNTKGDLPSGEKNYQEALRVLEPPETESDGDNDMVTKEIDNKLPLATAYQRMGWNMHKQGRNEDAVKYYKKSLKISIYGGSKFESLCMQSFSSMGIALTFLGHLEEAEKYHRACLQKREARLGKNHPFVGASINNLALLMQQQGDMERALEYHLRALEIKRASKAPVISLINSMSNVANAYNAVDRFEEAHALIDEAFGLIAAQAEVKMKDTEALLFNTRGKIYAKEGRLNEARTAFEKTIELSQEISLHGFLFMKRLVSLAVVQERQGDYSAALWTAGEAWKIKDETNKRLPHNDIVTECLQCFARVYKATDDRLNYVQTLYELESECLRRERACFQSDLYSKLDEINSIIEDTRRKMEHLSL